MALGELVVMGPVTDLETRRGVSQKTGENWSMTTAFIAGRRNIFRVLLNDALVQQVQQGDDVALVVYPEIFQGSVNYKATGLWSGELPARAA